MIDDLNDPRRTEPGRSACIVSLRPHALMRLRIAYRRDVLGEPVALLIASAFDELAATR